MSRRAIPRAVKRAVFERSNMQCEAEGCERVGRELEHRIPVALGGENTVENLWLACVECHREKTSAEDMPRIAKAKRQAGEKGQHARRNKAKAAGTHKAIQGRGFDKRFKKKFDGTVELRPAGEAAERVLDQIKKGRGDV